MCVCVSARVRPAVPVCVCNGGCVCSGACTLARGLVYDCINGLACVYLCSCSCGYVCAVVCGVPAYACRSNACAHVLSRWHKTYGAKGLFALEAPPALGVPLVLADALRGHAHRDVLVAFGADALCANSKLAHVYIWVYVCILIKWHRKYEMGGEFVCVYIN